MDQMLEDIKGAYTTVDEYRSWLWAAWPDTEKDGGESYKVQSKTEPWKAAHQTVQRVIRWPSSHSRWTEVWPGRSESCSRDANSPKGRWYPTLPGFCHIPWQVHIKPEWRKCSSERSSEKRCSVFGQLQTVFISSWCDSGQYRTLQYHASSEHLCCHNLLACSSAYSIYFAWSLLQGEKLTWMVPWNIPVLLARTLVLVVWGDTWCNGEHVCFPSLPPMLLRGVASRLGLEYSGCSVWHFLKLVARGFLLVLRFPPLLHRFNDSANKIKLK